MALKNIPSAIDCGCDELKTNITLATGMGALIGDATRYGAFRSVVSQMQDNTFRGALDPRDCSNKIFVDGTGIPKVTLEYHLPDCKPITQSCAVFDCEPGESAAPTMVTQDFLIDQCDGFKLSLSPQEWADTCCGLEEYYRQIANSREEGRGLAADMQAIISRAIMGVATTDVSYQAKLVSERVANSLNHPTSGMLRKLEEYTFSKLDAGAGYNYVLQDDGTPVGTGTWAIKALAPRTVNGCVTDNKGIVMDELRRQIERFVRQNPNCGTDITIIGGRAFEEFLYDLGLHGCCDTNGFDNAAVASRLAIYLRNIQISDVIDDLFDPNTFFIVERDSVAFFWYNLWSDPRYRTSQWAKGYFGANGFSTLYQEKGLREFGTITTAVGNCRDGNFGLTFDTMMTTKAPECLTNRTFDFTMNARWGMWTRPAINCGDQIGRTGIYKAVLVDVC